MSSKRNNKKVLTSSNQKVITLLHACGKIISTCGANLVYKNLCPPYNTVYYKGIVKLEKSVSRCLFYLDKVLRTLKGGYQMSKPKRPVQSVLIESHHANTEVNRMFLTYIHEEIKKLSQQKNKKEQ